MRTKRGQDKREHCNWFPAIMKFALHCSLLTCSCIPVMNRFWSRLLTFNREIAKFHITTFYINFPKHNITLQFQSEKKIPSHPCASSFSVLGAKSLSPVKITLVIMVQNVHSKNKSGFWEPVVPGCVVRLRGKSRVIWHQMHRVPEDYQSVEVRDH